MLSQPIPKKPQTIREAKRQYRKRSIVPSVSEAQQRRFARANELDRRAKRIQEQERIKKANAKKRAEKEVAERKRRRQVGTDTAVGKIDPGQRCMADFIKPRQSSKSDQGQQCDLHGIKDAVPDGNGQPGKPERQANAGSRALNQGQSEVEDYNSEYRNGFRGIHNHNDSYTDGAKTKITTEYMKQEQLSPRMNSRHPGTTSGQPRHSVKESTRLLTIIIEADASEADWTELLESNSQIERELEEQADASTSVYDRNQQHDSVLDNTIARKRLPCTITPKQIESPCVKQTTTPGSPLLDDANDYLRNLSTQDLNDIGSSPTRQPCATNLDSQRHDHVQKTLQNTSFDYGLSELTDDDWPDVS